MKKIIIVMFCFVIFAFGYIPSQKSICQAKTWHEISSFTTTFERSVPQRKENIKLSASKIDGTVINGGESFSFNKVVGERTKNNGYKESIVIENGVYTGGVGGGVCQTSTTLYNASIRAGLKIKEVHPHSLTPDYVEASFDAMVSSEGSDLVFENPYLYPIIISAMTNCDKLTIKIYATDKISGLEILPYSNTVKIITPPQSIEKKDVDFKDVCVPCGEIIQYRNAKQGKISKGYIVYKYNGKIIRIKQIRSDHYIPVQGIKIVGTLKEELEKQNMQS